MSIVLDATTKKLEMVLGGAVTTNELQWMTSYADKAATAFTPGVSDGVSNGTTDVVIVAAPGADEQRLVNNINIYNADTVDADVTVNLDNDGTERILIKFTLNAGDTLQYANDEWRVLDENGACRQSTTVKAEDVSIADAGDIITGTNVETALQENRTAVDLNTTHRTSTGADHSYLDQAVTIAGTPQFAGVQLGGTGATHTLDDYEGGTWTPSVDTNGFTQSVSSATGNYTKIGNLVYIQATITLGDSGYPSSFSAITGVPFTCSVSTAGVYRGSNPAIGNQGSRATLSTTTINLYEQDGTTASTTWILALMYIV